jgi:predicted enzyme related to lactoylglutathione lyase
MSAGRLTDGGYLPQSILVLLFSLGGLAASPAFELPPPSGSIGTEHHPGKMIWADLITPDLTVAESFYRGLFGWTFQRVHAGKSEYAVVLAGGRSIGGVLQRTVPPGEHRQPAWLTFIAVQDVDAARRIAMSHGAKSVSEPRTYAGRGRQAVLTDPEGAVFAILASAGGDPPDDLAEPGEWIWSALLAKDPAHSAGFYQRVFGYDVFDADSDDGSMHLVLSSDNYARSSVNTLPAGSARRHPHWLNFIRVIDAADTAKKAIALGGRILVEPHDDGPGGLWAVIADPAGAPIGVMEWSASESKAEPK